MHLFRGTNSSMEVNCSHISYKETGYFSKIVTDYLDKAPQLQPFYQHEVSLQGIKDSIEARKKFNTNRKVLVEQLTKQYKGLALNELQQQNIQSLLSENTFTITTAHQPNIFTGSLYFIYKIIHAIKLADELKIQLPEYNFVPFYYMGSEDADLEELGYIHLGGEKLVWETNQTGAVGRMKVDKNLLKLIDRIYGQIGIHPHGNELTELFKAAYTEGKTIQQATLELVNVLFQQFGLLIVIPDNAILKTEFNEVINKEVSIKFSHSIVESTINQLNKHYKVQAAGREINLFYLFENTRERIEQNGSIFSVNKLNKEWQLNEIQNELNKHPDRFSANVILRGVFQETILPNIAFIGGGGELAYWLELKKVFENVAVPYPILILRNSFILQNDRAKKLIYKLNLQLVDLFKPEIELFNRMVKQESTNQLTIKDEIEQVEDLYNQIGKIVNTVDSTLDAHIKNLEAKAIYNLAELEKKILRAEKRKFKQIEKDIITLRSILFPNNNLQERIENFSTYYAKEGSAFLDRIYYASNGIHQQFTIVG
jgi:bacillithiol biosynthesis cysteine-adding enzyme BshC